MVVHISIPLGCLCVQDGQTRRLSHDMMDSNLTIRVGYSYGGLKKRASNLIQYDRRAFLTMNIYEKILGCFMMQII